MTFEKLAFSSKAEERKTARPVTKTKLIGQLCPEAWEYHQQDWLQGN